MLSILSMDTCILCTEPLNDDDKRMEYACGCHTVHSACGLRSCVNSTRNIGLFRCATCAVVLFDMGYGYVEEGVVIPAVPAIIDRVDIQQLKQKQVEANKTLKIFKTYFQDQYATYRERIAPSLDHIRIVQRETITRVKDSEEYRTAISKNNSLNAAATRFRHKYDLDFHEFAKLNILQRGRGLQHRWYLHKTSPAAFIKYRFRIKIYPK